uniref:Uncharacterized protein n=1 Tax=Mycolicibacterium neoaurum VKM Ac-1815D TaxID=700508 RepID=V5XIW7_MYCNE
MTATALMSEPLDRILVAALNGRLGQLLDELAQAGGEA